MDSGEFTQKQTELPYPIGPNIHRSLKERPVPKVSVDPPRMGTDTYRKVPKVVDLEDLLHLAFRGA